MAEISVVNSIVVITFALTLLMLSGVLGHEFLRELGLIRGINTPILEAILPFLSIFFGMTVIGVVLFLTSLLGVLTKTTIIVLAVGQFALALFRHDFLLSIVESARRFCCVFLASSPLVKVTELTALGSFLCFVAVGLLYATLPASDADSATAYLNAANLFLQHGQLIDVGNFVGNMGKTGFLLLVYGMGAYSSMVGHALIFLLSALGIFLMYLLLRYFTNIGISVLLLIVVVTSAYSIEEVILPAKFDGATFSWSVACLGLLALFNEGERRVGTFVVFGALVGFLAGISYNNIAAAMFMVLALLFILRSRKDNKWLKLLAITAMAAIVTSAPTFVQNVLLFKNPVYPFAGNIFQSGLGSTIPPDTFAYQYIEEISRAYAARDLFEILALPFSMFGDAELVKALHDPALAMLLITALFGGVVKLGLIVLRREFRRDDRQIDLLVLTVVGAWFVYLFWAMSQHIFRYLSAGLPFVVMLGGLVLSQMWRRVHWGLSQPLTMTFVGIATVWMLASWPIGRLYLETRSWIARGTTENDYIAANFVYNVPHGFGGTLRDVRKILNDGDKILSFIGGSYYFGDHVSTFSGNGSGTLPSPYGMTKPLTRFASWEEWEAHIKAQRFNYLVINPGYLYLSEREKPIVMGFLANRVPDLVVGPNLVFRIQ